MKQEIAVNPWAEFYRKRINSGYQDYFDKRYKPLIDIIKNQKPFAIREEGVGIGSVSKSISKNTVDNLHCFGFDNDLEMIDLCRKNNPAMEVFYDSILIAGSVEHRFQPRPDVVVTHGVLEHFEDDYISMIFERYRREGSKNIHYVPTDGYDTPSFGDERLLPTQYWLDNFKPKDHLVFNDGKDLLLINL